MKLKNIIAKLYLKKYLLYIAVLSITSCNSIKKTITTDDSIEDLTTKSHQDFGKFLWSRKKDSTIYFHEKNFKIITKKYRKGNDKLFGSLDLYQSYMAYFYDNRAVENKISFSERAYIAGYVTDFLYRNKEKSKKSLLKDINFMNRLLQIKDNYSYRYNEEFKKHDYYGLEYLKKHHLKEYIDLPPYQEPVRLKNTPSD